MSRAVWPRCVSRTARGRVALLAGLVALLSGVGEMVTPCLAAGVVQAGCVDYRFIPSGLQVPLSLPTGTVMATTLIPGDVIGRRDAGEGALWSSAGGYGPVITVPTRLPGVGIRMVLVPGTGRPVAVTLSGGWNMWPSLPPLRGGGVQVELVKTGPVHPGTVSTIAADVQYRVPGRGGVHPRPARVVHLHYAGYLSLGILSEGHRDAGHRPS